MAIRLVHNYVRCLHESTLIKTIIIIMFPPQKGIQNAKCQKGAKPYYEYGMGGGGGGGGVGGGGVRCVISHSDILP